MPAVVAITLLHDALAELELAAALVLLAEQERERWPAFMALANWRSSWRTPQAARAVGPQRPAIGRKRARGGLVAGAFALALRAL